MALYSDIVERELCKKYFPGREGVLKVKGMQDSPIANYSGMSKAVDIPVQTWSGEDSPLITCWKEANTWINTIFQLCVFSHVCILEVNELKVKQTTYNHPFFIFWWSVFFKHSYTLSFKHLWSTEELIKTAATTLSRQSDSTPRQCTRSLKFKNLMHCCISLSYFGLRLPHRLRSPVMLTAAGSVWVQASQTDNCLKYLCILSD